MASPTKGGAFGFLNSFLDTLRSKKTNVNQPIGVAGTVVYGGFIQSPEKDRELLGWRKYITYDELRANVEIIATSCRYFLDLIANPAWKFEPAQDENGKVLPGAQKIAEFMEDVFEDIDTPMRRVKRRMGMYRFHGFSIHEWTAKKRDDGKIGLLDLDIRPQSTIYRWDLDVTGNVLGVVQRSPQTFEELYLPSSRILHLLDDAMSDSPEGFGLFRNAVPVAKALLRYEMLEGWGFEADLRGIPIAKAPLANLAARLKSGEIDQPTYDKMVNSVEDFLKNHIKSPQLGLLIDSEAYPVIDGVTPSSKDKWGMDLLKGGATTQQEVNVAIERKTTSLARLFGCEHLMIGGNSRGSNALARDKSVNLASICDSSIDEMTQATTLQVVKQVMRLNGFDLKLTPRIKSDKVKFRDISEVTTALFQMAQAGMPLTPDDPADDEIRDLLGISRRVPGSLQAQMDASLRAKTPPPVPGAPPPAAPKPGVQPPPQVNRTTPPKPAPGAAGSKNGKATAKS